MLRAGLLLSVFAFLLAATAWSGQNPDVKVTIHLLSQEERTCTENFPVLTGCEDVSTCTGYDHQPDVFLVFYNLTGYSLLEYGVHFYYADWEFYSSCSDQVIIDNFGYELMGVTQFYDSCQPGPVAIPLWFRYWWAEGNQICIVEHPITGEISVGDCDDPMGIDHAPYVFCLGLGGWEWCTDPCAPTQGPVPVEGTTWGEVKALFR